jgi:glycosyltransferase involved in cell wall biosynthesis
LGINCAANITGLGSAVYKKNILSKLIITLYKFSLLNCKKVFFHNESDCKLFIEKKIISTWQAKIIPGSGVDLTRFSLAPLPRYNGIAGLNFLMIARLIKDKGVVEYLAAAELLSKISPDSNFYLLGDFDLHNPSKISFDLFRKIKCLPYIKYFGLVDDVIPHIQSCHCLVLPSYSEGLPRSMLEASACGRILIGTCIPGITDIISERVNGFFCQPRNVQSLVVAMEKVLQLSSDELITMSNKSRQIAEEKFSADIVISEYIGLLDS